MTPLERSRGLGTRLATLLPIEGTAPEAAEGPGRGVHAIIPVAESGHVDERAPGAGGRLSLRHDQAIFVGLEILQSALPVDLAAYIHQRRGKRLQVHIRTTAGEPLDPEVAFSLSDALARTYESRRTGESSAGPVMVEGYTCISVRTNGTSSRGLHVLGRYGPPLSSRDRILAERFCRLLGQSLHRAG